MSSKLHRLPEPARRIAFAVALTLFAPQAALGQASVSSTAAQGLFDEARSLMAAGRTQEACPKLEESQRLDPGSGTLVNLAKCYEDTGRIASAWSTYLEAASAARAAGNPTREEGARGAAAALAHRTSKLVVNVPHEARVPGLIVKRGGVPVGPAQWGTGIPLDAGEYAIEASAAGYEPWRAVARVEGEGTTATIAVPKLARLPPAAASTAPARAASGAPRNQGTGLGAQRVVALAAGGVGVAGLVVGTVFGLKAMSGKSEAEKSCSGTACTTDDGVRSGKDAYQAGNVATIGMVIGGVGVASGLALWLTAPEGDAPLGVVVGAGDLRLRGAF